MIDRDRHEELAQLRRLKIASLAEATTLLLLVAVAVPLKHLASWSFGVRIMGPVHGLAFVAYLWTVLQTISAGSWHRAEAARLIAVAFVSFGRFLNAPFLVRKEAAYRAGRAT